jgi:putative oxidoreductase
VTSQSHDSTWRRPGASPEPVLGRPASASLVDPEDDLTPVGYPSEFGTTTEIPSYHPGTSGASGSVHNLMDSQEPLPYAFNSPQPAATQTAEPAAIDPDADDDRLAAAGRRGTQHLGLLVLRVGLGVVLGAHGLQKLFGWWGGHGMTGFKSSLADAGYHHADILAYVSAGGEIVSGALLVLGLFTPVAAAGALACLINGLLAAISAKPHSHNFSFFLPGGHEYQITLIVVAIAVILCGPGRYGLDAGRGWAYRPFIGSFVALLCGIGAGVAVWILLNGGNPVA